MAVIIGEVRTFPDARADKAQVMKMFEETAEVFNALLNWEWSVSEGYDFAEEANIEHLIDECADLIQATSNLLAGLGVDDMQPAMIACESRNRERGRL